MSLSFYDAGSTYDSGIRYADGALFLGGRIPLDRIKLPFAGKTLDPALADFQHIIASMDTKPAFAALQAQVTVFKAKVDALVAKRAAQLQAAADAVQFALEREQLFAEATALGTTLGSGVENLANGVGAIMVDAGYGIRSGRTPGAPLIGPENLRATMSGMTGVIKLRWRKLTRASSYCVERANDANGPWIQIGVTVHVTFDAAGLASGTKYYFRVCGVGPDGPGPWSDIAEKMAP